MLSCYANTAAAAVAAPPLVLSNPSYSSSSMLLPLPSHPFPPKKKPRESL